MSILNELVVLRTPSPRQQSPIDFILILQLLCPIDRPPHCITTHLAVNHIRCYSVLISPVAAIIACKYPHKMSSLIQSEMKPIVDRIELDSSLEPRAHFHALPIRHYLFSLRTRRRFNRSNSIRLATIIFHNKISQQSINL